MSRDRPVWLKGIFQAIKPGKKRGAYGNDYSISQNNVPFPPPDDLAWVGKITPKADKTRK